MDKVFLQNAVFLPQVSELLMEGKTVTLRARGVSMRPFIEHDRDDLVFAYRTDIKVGDVVLAEVSKGHFVCHRIEQIKGISVTLRGDGNVRGTESCTLADIRGKLIKVNRLGKVYDLETDRFWHYYSIVWPKLLPVRRWLLAFNKVFFLHQMPERIRKYFRKQKQ